MTAKVLIEEDFEYEMIRISVNGKVEVDANFWDLTTDTWVRVLEKAGVGVSQVEYDSEEAYDGEEE